MAEPQQLAREFSTKARALRAVGSVVLDKSPLTGETYILRARELRLQKALLRALDENEEPGAALARACFESGVTMTFAKSFFDSARYKRWIADRMEELEINERITPGFIAKKHLDNIEGRLSLTSQQLVSLQELSDRVWPKVQKVEMRMGKVEMTSMDDLLAARNDVDELEKKLIEAHREKAA